MGDLAQPPEAIASLVQQVYPWKEGDGAEAAQPDIARDEGVSRG